MIKVRFLFEGNFKVEGHPRHYKKGDIDNIPKDDAARLVQDLCAEYLVTDKPKAKVKHDR